MGTDVHAVWQKKTNNKWEDVQSNWNQNRHYQLFAVLAGVRNGFGFGGIKTGDAIQPISEPRGLPQDFVMSNDVHPTEEQNAPEYLRGYGNFVDVWLGDHSHSWLTSEEMLKWYEHAEVVTKIGVITIDQFKNWDGKEPESYCGATFGPGVKVCDVRAEITEGCTHVKVYWDSPLKEELKYFFDEVARLHNLYGGVRLVFGFDS